MNEKGITALITALLYVVFLFVISYWFIWTIAYALKFVLGN